MTVEALALVAFGAVVGAALTLVATRNRPLVKAHVAETPAEDPRGKPAPPPPGSIPSSVRKASAEARKAEAEAELAEARAKEATQ